MAIVDFKKKKKKAKQRAMPNIWDVCLCAEAEGSVSGSLARLASWLEGFFGVGSAPWARVEASFRHQGVPHLFPKQEGPKRRLHKLWCAVHGAVLGFFLEQGHFGGVAKGASSS